jgi:ribosomal-protein-alanine N-acetyltransferase
VSGTGAGTGDPGLRRAASGPRAGAGRGPGAEPVLRPMRWWDIPNVLILENDAFAEDAWSVGMFWSELAEAASRRYVIAEEYGFDQTHPDREGPRIIGYAGLMVGSGEAEVQTIAVDRLREGRGVGALLLTRLLAEAAWAGCDHVLLEVRVDNLRAQRLYRGFGFESIGLRRGYYQPANVDALVMRTGSVIARFGGPEPDDTNEAIDEEH